MLQQIRWAVWASGFAALSCAHGPRGSGLAESTPHTPHTGVCYEVFVRSFADADGDGVGDLRGLIAHLDYINDGNPQSSTDLGANCIWLMPIAKSVSYHGYDVTDYYHVDPRYGTDQDFRELVRAAHSRGIRIIVDFVPNHSSSDHPWFQSALKDPASPYRSWYRWSTVNPNQPGPWGQVAWHKSPVRDEYYYGVFWHGMPDLNYGTPAVVQEMQKVTAYWLKEMGVDGFRFDAIPYLVEEGDQLKHTPGTHEVLHVLGDAIRRDAPGSFTIGEMADGPIDILASYYPEQLDAYFAFDVARGTVEAARTGLASPFVRSVQETNAKLPAGRWSPFLTNHDQPRIMTVVSDVAKARVAASAMLMLPGVAFAYYGEEIGMIGPKPDEQIRTPMQWSSAAGAGFTTGTPWEAPQPDWASKNVAAQNGDPASLLNHYRRLIHLRNEHPALTSGDLEVGTASNAAVAAIVRRSPEEKILIALNFGDRLIDRVGVSLAPALRGGRFGLERLYGDPSSACVVIGISADGAMISLGKVAPHGLCVFRVVGDHAPAGSPSRPDAALAGGIASADSLIGAAVGTLIPGAVFLVSRNGRVVHERAFGYAQLNDYEMRRLAVPRPMRTSTMFDLASVTKVMATTMATMLLVDRGLVDVDSPVSRYLPDFRGPHLDSITVRHLLQHSSGLVQWQPLYYHASNGAQTYAVIRDMPLQWGVGDARHYSDLGFMLLGYIVERVSGVPLDAFLEQNLYRPLGLRSTTFNPKAHGFTDFAETEQGNIYERHMVYDSTFGYRYRGDPTAWNGWRQYVLNGEVDDGNSFYANGGVAGHAGLFSTAGDVRVLLDLLNNRGSYAGHQYIRPQVVDMFLTRDKYQNYLGWQAPTVLPDGSFSHTGFTGTYVLGVPKYGLSIVLLTNRQDMGTNASGYFPDVGPLQQAVAKAVVNSAALTAN